MIINAENLVEVQVLTLKLNSTWFLFDTEGRDTSVQQKDGLL
jgi:hypothetical protein